VLHASHVAYPSSRSEWYAWNPAWFVPGESVLFLAERETGSTSQIGGDDDGTFAACSSGAVSSWNPMIR
jgi:hypothetical protein